MSGRSLLLVTVLTSITTGCILPTLQPAAAPTMPEEAAARDALVRFASTLDAEYLPVAPNPLLGNSLPEVKGCTLEFVGRAALAQRHAGERTAPMILAVTVQPPAQDGTLTVLVSLEASVLVGFEEWPNGQGCEYVYQPTADGAEFVREQGWVE